MSARELLMEQIERIKHMPKVKAALDAYFRAIRAWGIEDNTPLRLMEAEDAMIMAVADSLASEPVAMPPEPDLSWLAREEASLEAHPNGACGARRRKELFSYIDALRAWAARGELSEAGK